MAGLLAKRRLKNVVLFIPNMLALCVRLLTDKRVPFADRDAMKKLVDPVMAAYAKEIGADGRPGSKWLPELVDTLAGEGLAGLLDLAQLRALIGRSRLFVGGDNLASPPDSAFTINDAALTVRLRRRVRRECRRSSRRWARGGSTGRGGR